MAELAKDANGYIIEKQELPAPVSAPVKKQRGPGFCLRFLRIFFLFLTLGFVVDLFTEQPTTVHVYHHCMGKARMHGHGHGRFHGEEHNHHDHDHKDHRHHVPNVDNWKPFQGETKFEFDAAQANGLTIKGAKTFGKIVFETSKLSDKVSIELDIRTKKVDSDHQISVTEDNGRLSINAPDTGKLKTYASAKISIPSNIIGTFGLPRFEIDAPRHMVDYSALPESLEIGELTIRLAKGFVKVGKVHTNVTQLTVAKGGIRGSVVGGRYETNIDVAAGRVIVDVDGISAGDEGATLIHVGKGSLNGTFSVYNSTTLDVASGSLWSTVKFEESENRGYLSTKVASGNSRVFVDTIPEERTFDASHLTISGSQLLTYPTNWQGTVDARGLVGDIKLAGDSLVVEKAFGGSIGKKGDENRSKISVKAAKGSIDFLVGDEQ